MSTTSNRINFAFVSHCHQPPGNLPWVVEEHYQRAYLPFLETLRLHPGIRVGLHLSGSLLEWLEKAHPEYLAAVSELAALGQVELLAGAFYEPIACLVPDDDFVDQIRVHADHLVTRLGYAPAGMWLAERVWSPSLPALLHQAGIGYVLVDGENITALGLSEEEAFGYFLTEHAGASVALLPINKTLRQMIPFRPVEEAVDYLLKAADQWGTRLAVWADDGEKLGGWPGTYSWVYEQGWLESFFSQLEARDEIRVVTPRQFLAEHRPLGRIYLRECSYEEMMRWSGGNFRSFLTRYPEANEMHKRMLTVSRRLSASRASLDTLEGLGPKGGRRHAWDHARRHLWAAQTNCPYWHGVWGGLYTPHLRSGVYQHLLLAEKELDFAEDKRPDALSVSVADVNCDGFDEIAVSTGLLSLTIQPGSGSALTELGHRPRAANLLATLRRRIEPYHTPDDTPALPQDWHGRHAFLDHFLGDWATPEGFAACRYPEQGDFVNQEYAFHIPPSAPGEATIQLRRNGHVWVGAEWLPMAVTKTYSLDWKAAAVPVEYRLENLADRRVDLWFAVEINLALSRYDFPEAWLSVDERQRVALEAIGDWTGVTRVAVGDQGAAWMCTIEPSCQPGLWTFLVTSWARSEYGPVDTPQCLCLLLHWHLALGPQEAWETTLNLTLHSVR